VPVSYLELAGSLRKRRRDLRVKLGSACLSISLSSTSAHPATKPMKMELPLVMLSSSPKNKIPLKANGSLLRAPTILYVVLEVARIHHDVV
jgi:hypothetical protein